MKYLVLLTMLLLGYCRSNGQDLKVIDQDYHRALEVATVENKLIFVDFYTTWCVPCKQLDKLVFQHDSVKQQLSKEFILLKYDAEKDSVFHLSKKHHVMSYPTGLILDRDGYVIERKYGFPGDDFQSLSKSVFEFTNKALVAAGSGKKLKGYSNRIDASKYPRFYTDYINRTNTNLDTAALIKFWRKQKNLYSEEYFSTLIYFYGEQLPEPMLNELLKNKSRYESLFGNTDVEVLFYFLSSGKFEKAVAKNNETMFDKAIEFTRTALGESYLSTMVPYYKKELLIHQNKWNEVFEINEQLKNSGKFNNEAVNSFCWNVYRKCEDPGVITKCLQWMKELTDQKPEFAYLDTYAFLLYKSGSKEEAKRIIPLAIAAAKVEKENAKKLEELLLKL
ncbi:thioredoxin family protein [Terrimonas sp. NA20]|uniref:Thioredoxin family protein n=1 Tax=Terrimonas ginsenosidimutans TaxID=2908004 RepID=A0ABS9KTM0_9BACT|nr:thioredoxin family protein [Terrimonas ginsenosidimutans]MCG2615640.1 thioredoxin family protein [Terrimonas ginsenosidimutans]